MAFSSHVLRSFCQLHCSSLGVFFGLVWAGGDKNAMPLRRQIGIVFIELDEVGG